MKLPPRFTFLTTLFISLFLTACGGGGGGGSSSSPPPAADVAITSANSEDVARASYRATTVLGLVLPAQTGKPKHKFRRVPTSSDD